ncbi:MAG: hypothetical protein NUW01_00130 [Gemmatimonadaceae bacterium]|nr:hypothetical protein [Gemmatimonadaceae bacterium]
MIILAGVVGLVLCVTCAVLRSGRGGEADAISDEWRRAEQRNCVREQIEEVLEKARFA